MRKKRVAIIGGGMGSLSAAFALTSKPGWDDEYEVTVHQMGWRLGGKGASGRNAEHGQRIEEHGLHVWLGFYDNAFTMIQAAYAERPRRSDDPFVSWTDAFKKHSAVVLMERVGERWIPWPLNFAENGLVPGDGAERAVPTVWSYVRKLIAFVHDRFAASALATKAVDACGATHLLEATVEHVAIATAHELAKTLGDDPMTHPGPVRALVVRALADFAKAIWKRVEPEVEKNDDLRRLFVVLEMGALSAFGMIKDGAVDRGLDALDGFDYVEWLRGLGASEITLSSAPIRGFYDLVFGFDGGDPSKPNFAAGVALRSALHVLFDYKGAVFWKMQAGMGDTVFTPLYEVLRARGVRFEFFHKVSNLGLSADKSRIDTIDVVRQAPLANGAEVYDPLVVIKGLGCWPSTPRYEQIAPTVAQEIARRGVDLESYYGDWAGERFTLTRGNDFDVVILGVPPAAIAEIGPELVQASPRWGAMMREVKSVATQAMQLWLTPTIAELGWTGASPILDAYADPQNTWADMTHLVPRETWSTPPGSLAYFCGPMRDLEPSPDLPERALRQATDDSTAWLAANIRGLWPAGVDSAPWVSSYFRANVEPSERYVLSAKGSSAHRIAPGDSGVSNLFLAGDWTDNGFNAGCIEAATMSGLLCARAMTGWPIEIAWDPTV